MAKPKKVSVKDELPKDSGIYSAFTDESVSVKAIYKVYGNRWYGLISKKNITELITHWVKK